MKRIVIALGGNALGNTAKEQLQLVTETGEAVVFPDCSDLTLLAVPVLRPAIDAGGNG